jgi:predicted pyridoxine 5'-phosphate oxidase superfamily flavin-nucleotide-binding protein
MPMAESFTPAARELIAKKVLAHVASLDADGGPNVSPVWVELDGDDLVINTARFEARSWASRRSARRRASIAWRRNIWVLIPIRIGAKDRSASP